MRHTLSFVLAFVLALAATARAEIRPGQPADFEGTTLAGTPFKLSSLRGKVVLVDFWASWCEPCQQELPLLDKLAPKLRARGVEIVAVDVDDNKDKGAAFVRAHDLGLTVVLDSDKKIVGTFAPAKMPSSFVVDKQGIVRAVHGGFQPGDEARIESELTGLAR
ncbi:MAG TPA: TlpA disulfide reductase family protein [Polyangia bacterium]|nr:TlpA disulfide reductase family protein [Polyangia bacterium]